MTFNFLWSIFCRLGQISIESSSTLVVGLVVAAILKNMVGSEGTRKLFGGDNLNGLFRAWVIGSLLPVCSIGVIPVAFALRRAGVPSSTILSFVLAAPQLNPLSLLYGLTLSDPLIVIFFIIATMIIAILGGEIWKRFFETKEDNIIILDDITPVSGLKRLLSVLFTSSSELVSINFLFIATGLLFTGLVSGLLPYGIFSNTMRHHDIFSPLLMTLFSFPSYLGVLPGMMKVGLIFEHGNSVGAGFILFEFGVGFNLGLLFFLGYIYGWKRISLWVFIIILFSLGIAYSIEYPLYFAKEEINHTHAFDEWNSPFSSETVVNWEMVSNKISQKIEVLEPFALALLFIFISIGLLSKFNGLEEKINIWLVMKPNVENIKKGSLDIEVPNVVLGIVSLLVLILFSFVALFIYYPAPKEAFSEIVKVRTNSLVAIRTNHKEEAIRQIQQWDLLTRKLQVGIFLRTGILDPEVSKLIDQLREDLEETRDFLIADNKEEAVKMISRIEQSYQNCKKIILK